MTAPPPAPTGVPADPYEAAATITAALGSRLNLPHGGQFRVSLPFTGKAEDISALAQAATAFALMDIAASLRRLAPEDPRA